MGNNMDFDPNVSTLEEWNKCKTKIENLDATYMEMKNKADAMAIEAARDQASLKLAEYEIEFRGKEILALRTIIYQLWGFVSPATKLIEPYIRVGNLIRAWEQQEREE